MRRLNKRGQFFLLSSVIISAIVLSFGAIDNGAEVNPEPRDFEDFSYDMKREAGSVIEYEIYSNFQSQKDIDDFVRDVADDIRDSDPFANFMFIYGDTTDLYLKNYGSELVYACTSGDANCNNGIPGGGNKFNGTLYYGSTSQDVSWSYSASSNLWEAEFNSLVAGSTLDVIIGGDKFAFPIEDSKQVIFVIQKEVENENFVSIR